MRNFPDARNAEFKELFRHRPARAGECVLDVPAGGGYLARTLPAGVAVLPLELTGGFAPEVRVIETYGDWEVGRHDHSVCLAGLHHIDDQDRFVSQLVRHTRKGGTVHVADVDRSQPLARYLDGFVGRYNSTGHEGKYLTAASFRTLAGTRLIASEIRDCPWRFDSEASMLAFCAGLFGLSDYPEEELRSELARDVGTSRDGDTHLVNWRLRYIDLEVT
jgi:SAM-dependent methyltransferase